MLNQMTYEGPSKGLSTEKTDAEFDALVRKAMKGRRQAVVDLVSDIARGVLVSVRLLYHKQMADVEDIAQEALIKVCENIHSLKEPEAFAAWLNRVVLNEVRRYIQKNAKQAEVVYIDDYVELLPEENEEYLPLEFQLRNEESRTIKEIINALPDQQREAIVLHYYKEFSITDTARIMNVARQSASLYLKLAREKIKKELLKRARESGDDRLYLLAGLPIGPLTAQSLNIEASQIASLSHEWEQRVRENLLDRVSRSAKPYSGRLLRSLRAALGAKAAAAITALVVLGAIAAAAAVTAAHGSELPRNAPAFAATDYRVILTGGEAGFWNLNPIRAQADAGDTAPDNCRWVITTADGSQTLMHGEGDIVEDAFTQLGEGEYMLRFTLTYDDGREVRVFSNFQIMK